MAQDPSRSYPKEMFLNDVDPDTLCPVCLGVCHDPVVCKDGHSFCEICLKEAMKRTFNKCPLDRAYIGGVLPTKNRPLQNIIGRMMVRCPSSLGSDAPSMCHWKGKLDDLKAHENNCGMQLKKCTFDDCKSVIYAYELEQHQMQCRFRKECCPDCEAKVPVSCIGEHSRTSCAFKKIECPNRCNGHNIVRGNVVNHIRNGCQKDEIGCPMECGSLLKFKDVQEHFHVNVGDHLNFMHTKLLESRENTARVCTEVYDNPIIQWRLDKLPQLACSPSFESHVNSIKFYIREMELYIKLESKMGFQSSYTSGMLILKSGTEERRARWEWTTLTRNKTLKITGLLDELEKDQKVDIVCALKFGF